MSLFKDLEIQLRKKSLFFSISPLTLYFFWKMFQKSSKFNLGENVPYITTFFLSPF